MAAPIDTIDGRPKPAAEATPRRSPVLQVALQFRGTSNRNPTPDREFSRQPSFVRLDHAELGLG